MTLFDVFQPRLTNSLITAGKSSDELVLDMAADMMANIPEVVEVSPLFMILKENNIDETIATILAA